MLKLTPLLLAMVYGYVMFRFSAWRSARELDAKSTALAAPSLVPLLDQLAAALEVARIKVHVYEVPQINGLATHDGRIFITRGFLDRHIKGEVSAEELTSVIAHELGHVALGHAKTRMNDFFGQNAMRSVLAMVLNRYTFGFGGWVADRIMSLHRAGLSRADEFEADEYAAALLTKAGIGTAPLTSLFEKLEHWSAETSQPVPAWFMSHPKPGDRIKAIQKLEKRWAKASDR
ncbi:M48 family metalloprotease [uncultured Pelagimonas sp.]|uniref:M48 family metalloprotease n=1 Tax=uncultured Pelagimonas sp. TaxID=1618102 RepID=UPI0026220356|nr:M48 family metalloprotease [uncultured Pelagimonas sp.]